MIAFSAEPVALEDVHPAYLRMVDYLTARPECADVAWDDPSGHPCGALFRFASPRLSFERDTGCLSMVRGGGYLANERGCPGLTQAIRDDDQLPTSLDFRENPSPYLLRFAQWQTALDILWSRPKPTFTT